jgi:P27 family predicted phage terminase small subunit
MVRGGHNKVPTPIRIATGNPSKRPINTDEPVPDPLEDLTPPSSLDAYGKACWERNARVLRDMGVLTMGDVDVLTVYCDAYSQWRHTSIAVRKIKPGDDEYRKVAVSVEKARDQMRYLGAELGLSPTSRGRLAVKQAEVKSEMEGLLSGRNRAS